MIEPISRLSKRLTIEYGAFLALIVLLVVLYEADVLPQGQLVGVEPTAYILQVAGVLITVALIPLALRLFGMGMLSRVRELPLEQALVSYHRWNQIRLALLLVVVVINLAAYYLTLQTTGALCAVMALLSALCCLPSRRRILRELEVDEQQ